MHIVVTVHLATMVHVHHKICPFCKGSNSSWETIGFFYHSHSASNHVGSSPLFSLGRVGNVRIQHDERRERERDREPKRRDQYQSIHQL